ncbi:MAG: hypothetical protein EXQ67_08385 [Thermoleophilia bacterium]|nr:hypothetical protein [Thermoleophilia bacterium]
MTREGAIYVAEIYNTIGYNDCPEDKWVTITEEEVNADYGSEEAKINGPRFWAFDTLIGSGSSTGGKTYVFGGPDGIEMQVRGSLETKPREGTVGEEFYTVNEVGRDTIFVYDADQLVFELTDPEGQVYMMQSYAQIADKTLTYDQLATMGSKLDLPEGWTYASRMLTERFELNTDVSDGKAFVINDNLYNSYQRRVEG